MVLEMCWRLTHGVGDLEINTWCWRLTHGVGD